MKFRPCIDIHNGKVKQIVGGSLKDFGNEAKENFVSEKSAAEIASMFKEDAIEGAHVIILNNKESEYFEATRKEALSALRAYPGGLQIGGGINADNAGAFIEAGAGKVIVTSFAFSDGKIQYDNLKALKEAVGRDRIVLDLSCRKNSGKFCVVTDRWQKFTTEALCPALFENLKEYASEFLVHGVDVEGKKQGIDDELIKILANASMVTGMKITYAGGIGSLDDIKRIEEISGGTLDFTVGSALDLYGGKLSYKNLKEKY